MVVSDVDSFHWRTVSASHDSLFAVSPRFFNFCSSYFFYFFLGGLSLSHTNLNRIPFRDEHITGNGKQPWGVWEGVCAQLDARHTDHHEVRSSAIWYLVNEEIDTRYT